MARFLALAVTLLGYLHATTGLVAQAAPSPQDSVPAKEKKLLITPFAAPGYTPEQGGLVTAGALISFRTRPLFKKDTTGVLVQRSTVTFNGSYSTTGAITANVKLSSFWAGDALRVFADFVVKERPDHYWGVGYEAGKAPEGDSTTAYQRTSLSFVPKVLWRLTPSILVGPALDINSTTAADVSPGMAADPYYQQVRSREPEQRTRRGLPVRHPRCRRQRLAGGVPECPGAVLRWDHGGRQPVPGL